MTKEGICLSQSHLKDLSSLPFLSVKADSDTPTQIDRLKLFEFYHSVSVSRIKLWLVGTVQRCIMAVNVLGVVVMLVFYLMVLSMGIWASFKAKREQKESGAGEMEMSLLGNRQISWIVGIFTMTGEMTRLPHLCQFLCGKKPSRWHPLGIKLRGKERNKKNPQSCKIKNKNK